MTANVLEHRRAKAFADALAAHQSAGRRNGGVEDDPAHGHSTAMAELLAATDALAAVPAPTLDPEVRSVQRAQLLAAFEQAYAEGSGPAVPEQRRRSAHRASAAVSEVAARLRPSTRWGRRLVAGSLVAGIAVGGFAGVAVASTGALPGDTLYGMKRSLEGWQLDWAGSDSERGSLLLDQASTRMQEAQRLVVRSGGAGGSSALLSPATVEQLRTALADMHAEGTSGRQLLWAVYRSNGSLDPMRRLAVFAQSQDDQWSTLREQLPEQLSPVASQVTQLLDDMTADVEPLHILPRHRSDDDDQGPAGDYSSGDGPSATSGPERSATGTRAPSGGASRTPEEHGASPSGTAESSGSPDGRPTEVGVGGLVDGLTGGLTGTGSTPTGSTAGPATAPTGTATPGSPSAPPTAGKPAGITVPPLIPGLLPALGLDLG
ncbi:DUF5667 domain-containing protein [Streptomyces sp. NPDC092296]|uniref:DUF5667 domain-containing protein n=1 Tax=Streptomyces sp. NPDC092296 TaxID=3366012 RepID=UPI00380BF58A